MHAWRQVGSLLLRDEQDGTADDLLGFSPGAQGLGGLCMDQKMKPNRFGLWDRAKDDVPSGKVKVNGM